MKALLEVQATASTDPASLYAFATSVGMTRSASTTRCPTPGWCRLQRWRTGTCAADVTFVTAPVAGWAGKRRSRS
ncbi:hypothetical protein HBB16_11380 [Pseudonocardia sp. MCCB 268]|nr:hypothetical protein [Pseudonocardia cytotoxica]